MAEKIVTLISSGDLRLAANLQCWPAQQELEAALTETLEKEGYRVERAHPYEAEKGHGFIESQAHGMSIFRNIDPDRPLIVAIAAWQYSHHVLAGLISHSGPILTVANWSGQWPGLVGLLNLNGSLTKAEVPYSTLWSEDFTDEFFLRGLRTWLRTGSVDHEADHVRPAEELKLNADARQRGHRLAERLLRDKSIMGVFDEGCMGMYNAIIPDHLLNATGVFKERLSQSALYYETTQVTLDEAEDAFNWLVDKGMQFAFGNDPDRHLTRGQVLDQLRMYIAAVRIADDFGCDTIGIQYQQGLKDLLPASDLVEGLLNNTERPPVYSRDGKRELFAGSAVPHFNEADEGAGLDALVTHRVWKDLGYPPETTLHDVRWGQPYNGEYVWVFMISGAVPPAHFERGYADAISERQPPMFFRLGGGTIKGASKPGEIVWSRIYVEHGRLAADVGRGKAIALPQEETERLWQATNPEWPIMNAVLYGVSRDQFMARHKANHIQVAYAPDAEAANKALATKVAMFQALGIDTYICGDQNGLV